ncbi:MAG: hypothetical protein ACR2KV_00375 [Solirubrobacteraceae bacterium]
MSKLDSEPIEIAGPPEPIEIEVTGLHGAGPIVVTAADGLVVVSVGGDHVWLDVRAVDDLVHGLLEAQAMA